LRRGVRTVCEPKRQRKKIIGEWRKNNYMTRVFLIIGVMFTGWKGKHWARRDMQYYRRNVGKPVTTYSIKIWARRY